uniref:Sulfotransferase n=1 Tax=Pyramimonas obovata TaxID=1411642 RepID=A0A7S0RBE4_9CHLO|mmetsp:Transcript_30018/g.65619  ORF Transcript_30018/g.65619 Transcript_30018/m.65619 type:complete len:461 (+) Transcript_30018:273-1655(+)
MYSLIKCLMLLALASHSRIGVLGLAPLPNPASNRSTTFVLRLQKAGSSSLAHGFMPLWKNDAERDIWTKMEHDGQCGILRCTMRAGRLPAEASLNQKECGGIRATKGISRAFTDKPIYMSAMYSYTLPETLLDYKGAEFPQLLERVREYFSNFAVVSGHFKFGLHQLGHRGEFNYVTTLRDPVQRVLSQWNWWKVAPFPPRKGAPGSVHKSELKGMGLDEWLSNPEMHVYMKNNHMTRVLCGLGSEPPGQFFNEDTSGADLFPEVTEEHLKCAIRNLESHFSIVLLVEKAPPVFTDGRLAKLLGFRLPGPPVTVAPPPPPKTWEDMEDEMGRARSENATGLKHGNLDGEVVVLANSTVVHKPGRSERPPPPPAPEAPPVTPEEVAGKEKHYNKTPKGSPGQVHELTPRQEEVIVSLNELDIRLYQYAERLHEQSVERLRGLTRKGQRPAAHGWPPGKSME